jgi:hypothetical protein
MYLAQKKLGGFFQIFVAFSELYHDQKNIYGSKIAI